MRVGGASAGMHVLVWLSALPLPELPALVEAAAAEGVGLYPVTPYHLRRPPAAGLLFGYASLDEDAIDEGIHRFARVLKKHARGGWHPLQRG